MTITKNLICTSFLYLVSDPEKNNQETLNQARLISVWRLLTQGVMAIIEVNETMVFQALLKNIKSVFCHDSGPTPHSRHTANSSFAITCL